MSRTAKIIIFSLVLLVAIINKQSNTSIISSSKQSTSTNKKDLSKPNELDKILQNNESKNQDLPKLNLPTLRPSNGFSPYDGYYGKGRYNNSTDNIIEVTAPSSKDIVFILEDIYSKKKIRNEYVRSGTKFSLTGIPYGTYKFYYSYGNDWSSNADFKGGLAKGNFLKNKGVGKSDKFYDVEFEEGYYGTYEIILQLISNGNLTTVEGTENDL